MSFVNGVDGSAIHIPRCDIVFLQNCTFDSKQSLNFVSVGGIDVGTVGQLVISNTTFNGISGRIAVRVRSILNVGAGHLRT